MRKATGCYRTYSIPGKIAALVPEFAVEDLRLSATAALVLEFAVKEPALGQNSLMMSICSSRENLHLLSTILTLVT